MSRKSRALLRAQTYNTAAQNEIHGAMNDRQSNERLLEFQQYYLGREDEAPMDITDNELDYAGRFRTGSQATGEGWAQLRVAGANYSMEQAQAAAKAGNFEEAEKYKQEATNAMRWEYGSEGQRHIAARTGENPLAFEYYEDPNVLRAKARSRLLSPTGQIVSDQIRRAGDFQDWNSEESVAERSRLAEGGNRALGAAERSGARNARDFALASGNATSPYAQQALRERQQERLGTEKANVELQAALKFSDFRNAFAKDTVSFANDWMKNQAGIREEYQAAMDQLRITNSNLYANQAKLHENAFYQLEAAEAARLDRNFQVGMAVASLAIGGAGGITGIASGASSLASGAFTAAKGAFSALSSQVGIGGGSAPSGLIGRNSANPTGSY